MTFEQFKELISEISHVSVEDIRGNASFKNDLGIDSLQMVNLLVEITNNTGSDFKIFTNSDSFSTPSKLYHSLFGGKEI
ncbi:acyl carrier protein [Gracilibacillus sp. D59]|uniref:acyl carrier protein n=1 Tax=Gracilibacillus sp. D59 TaxID=3457434 RepID=UPI003FCC7378